MKSRSSAFSADSHPTIESHPFEDAIIVKLNNDTQQIINLKDLSKEVDIKELASMVIAKSPILSEAVRVEVEQVLFYLKRRKEREGSASSSATTSTIAASIDEAESYLELFYENIEEKKKAAQLFQELAKFTANLQFIAENEAIMGALTRVYRDDWKKNFELAIAIASVFVELSKFTNFHIILTHHKIGALSLTTLEYELKRADNWLIDVKNGDEKTARRCRVALNKQQILLTSCLEILINLSQDIAVEVKIARRDIIPLLVRTAELSTTAELRLAVVRMLLKLSIFQENITLLENTNIVDTVISWYPIDSVPLSKTCVKFLFNLVFNGKTRARMVKDGLVSHIAPLIKNDTSALHLLYQLSIDDEGKTMIKFTDSIQLLMRDLLSGDGSDVTKAVLLNVCVEKRNAQLICGPEGGGLDLLMEMSVNQRDLLVAKILRTIASHDGPTQEMFLKWMPKLIVLGKTDAIDSADDRAAIGLEWIATAALIKSAEWAKLITTNDLVTWMKQQLGSHSRETTPLQLQIVIMCGTMARNLDAARYLVPLVEPFLNLLHSLQSDDEYVLQLLYFFLQLLRHKELSEELMGPESSIGTYFVDLMHDRNTAIREMCDNALLIIGEHSQEWARKIAGARFRWHNEQWLSMIENSAGEVDDIVQPDDEFGLMFDDFSDGTGFESP